MEPATLKSFEETILSHYGNALYSEGISVFQVNIGLRCNQTCSHCHVASSPDRKEVMSWETMEEVVNAAKRTRPSLIDITGGEPGTHPHIREFISKMRESSFPVQVRTNLTILTEEPYGEIIDFFAGNNVRLVGSLPCYLKENVDRQRGEGVFEKSIEALKLLNAHGYGREAQLPLNLVYNPGNPFLPPPQVSLEAAYKKELGEKYGIVFTNLFTFVNMPIGRFAGELKRQDKLEEYRQLLYNSFNPNTLDGVMCRHQVNVGWDGRVYDCDFNFALGLVSKGDFSALVRDFNPEAYAKRKIVTGAHCFGCTAGSGSSCSGALV